MTRSPNGAGPPDSLSINDRQEPAASEAAQDAIDRMGRAHARKTGCHLTAEMIAALNVTFMGELWASPRPPRSAR